MGFPDRIGYGNGLIAIGQSVSDIDGNELVQNICQQNSVYNDFLYNFRLEGNRMSIPHRILSPDDPNKPFSKALTESDSSGDYVTPQSSMADVSTYVDG